jgi:hypothetical protein
MSEIQHMRTDRLSRLVIQKDESQDEEFLQMLESDIEKEEGILKDILKIVFYLDKVNYMISIGTSNEELKAFIKQLTPKFVDMYNSGVRIKYLQNLTDEMNKII